MFEVHPIAATILHSEAFECGSMSISGNGDQRHELGFSQKIERRQKDKQPSDRLRWLGAVRFVSNRFHYRQHREFLGNVR